MKLFRAVCAKDVEGVVAKRKAGIYQAGERWFKIRNRGYTQMAGRHELFDSFRPPKRAVQQHPTAKRKSDMSIKKYYRARGTNAWSFDWVDTPEEATADYFEAAKETQRKLNENYGLRHRNRRNTRPLRGLSEVRYFPNRHYRRADVGLATDSILARTDNLRHVSRLFKLEAFQCDTFPSRRTSGSGNTCGWRRSKRARQSTLKKQLRKSGSRFRAQPV